MADYRSQVRKWFRAYVPTMKVSSELKNILIREAHPNLENFFNNMSEELKKVQGHRVFKGQKPADESQLKWLVESMTDVFVSNMETQAKRRYESDLARLQRERDAQKKFEFDETLAGRATGEFAEAGVITNEKIDQEREVNE